MDTKIITDKNTVAEGGTNDTAAGHDDKNKCQIGTQSKIAAENYPPPLNPQTVRARAKARGFKLETSCVGYGVIDPSGLLHGFAGSLERCGKWIDQWPTIEELDQYQSLNTITGEMIKVSGEIELVVG